jgi:DNA polymerase-3 subunit epsilon
MSLYDPPSDPEYIAHACRNCDQAMEKDLIGEWICKNRRCQDSTAYDHIYDAHETAAEWARGLLKKDPADWVILDTETTGLSDTDEVVQVAMVNGAGDVLMDNVLIKPTISISRGASNIHGITDEVVKDASNFVDVWLEIHMHAQGKQLVIYNAQFDTRMLWQSAKAQSHTIALPCTVCHDAMGYYAEWVGEWNDYHGNFRWQRLPGGDHTALGDCLATLEIIKDMAAG